MSHTPRKRFGQHFLIDQQVISDIVTAVAPRRDAKVVEIGPGLGALTEPLLQRLDHLHVIEIDRDIVARLKRLHSPQHLSIHEGDALSFDFATLPGGDSVHWQLVGNLPYNISTPLLFRFLEQEPCILDMHLMLQREVVERIVADPGDKTYGRLSVMIQTRCEADLLFRIGPGAFVPAPKVESAFLRLRPLRPLPHPLDDPGLHARLVAAAFSQRRKTLRNALSGLAEAEDFAGAGIDPGLRAESVDVESFVRLANQVGARGCKGESAP